MIDVPAITLQGDANGAPHPDPTTYAEKFTGPYSHRTIDGGIGHNLPQEAPQAFAEAVLELTTHYSQPVARSVRFSCSRQGSASSRESP